jgi:uncharacterized protein
MLTILEAADRDFPELLRLNTGAVPHVNHLSAADLARLRAEALACPVAMVDDRIAGFVLVLSERAHYDSPNFRWFQRSYPTFTYVDRVVVAPEFRRMGIGLRLYQEVEAIARKRGNIFACEVNVRPPNPGSTAFHRDFGFVEVGQLDTENGAKRVSLLVKHLDPGPD